MICIQWQSIAINKKTKTRHNPFPTFSDNCRLLAYLTLYFGSWYCKHNALLIRSSLTRVHSVCFCCKSFQEFIWKNAADVISRRHFWENIDRTRIKLHLYQNFYKWWLRNDLRGSLIRVSNTPHAYFPIIRSVT